MGGAGFYRASDGLWVPFPCGRWSCPVCGPARARVVRAGLRRSCYALRLKDMLTLTLDPGWRGESPKDSRSVISERLNGFLTALRQWGRRHQLWARFDYVWVVEFHEDGTAHIHMAVDLEPMAVAFGFTGGENRKADADALSNVWGKVSELWGAGFVNYKRGTKGYDSVEAYRYLSKYLGKMQHRAAPWENEAWCTEDGDFRGRPWHRFGGSAAVTALMGKDKWGDGHAGYGGVCAPDCKCPRNRKDRGLKSEFILARPVFHPSGRVTADLWNPAKGSAIVVLCDGHAKVPEWVPGSCHHEGGVSTLGACLCVPPWAYEPPWAEPPHFLEDGELEAYRAAFDHKFNPTQAQLEADEYRGWGRGSLFDLIRGSGR